MFCARYALQRYTQTGDELKPLPCKSWLCETCMIKRKKQLIRLAASGNPNKMLTITVSTSIGDSPTHRRKLLHDAWVILKQRMQRKLKVKALPYLAFVEKTQAGEPHLHILLRCKYIHYKWYSRQLRQLLQSPVVWIEKIRGVRKAVHYVCKYLTKAPAQFGRMKRYWRAKSYEQIDPDSIPFEKKRQSFDRILPERYSEIVEYRLNHGWALKPLEDGWIDFMKPGKIKQRPGYIFKSPGSVYLRISRDYPSEHVEDVASLNKGRFGE